MRGIVKHNAPERMQPEPVDNTTREVLAQVKKWMADTARSAVEGTPADDVEVIHTQSAMEIAAWWHSPSSADAAITVFSHTGTIENPGLVIALDDIVINNTDSLDAMDVMALLALKVYVKAAVREH